MIGIPKVIATRADLEQAASISPQAAADFVALLRGAATKCVDAREYPEGYAASGPEADDYLPPLIEERVDASPLERFGFESVAALDAWAAKLYCEREEAQ